VHFAKNLLKATRS